ncbi:MAG TPA: response regulator [Burkholderiales bacterium]|nr:response regulator [Burkholderiales bacterium]
MADSYSQTAKGKAEFAAKPGKLTVGLKTLLGLVGDKATVADLKLKLPQVPLDKLMPALDRLVADGYLQRAAPPQRAHAESSLDFTRFINRPVKEPTLQQKRNAEATIAGIRPSKTAGYHVSIINRPPKRIAPNAGGDKHTILLIDADDANALVMTRALLLAKFDTRTAGKREEIIAELNKKPPADAIAMDVALPDVGGLELLGRLRDHPTYKTVPIIVMTATTERDDVVAALSYGASGYMSKPFKPEALVESVKAALGL